MSSVRFISKYLAVIACIVLSARYLPAQNCEGSISGIVYQADAHQPLQGATIYLWPSAKGVVTDVQGRYTFDGLCPDDYKVICRHLGFREDTLRLHLQNGERLTRHFHLRPQTTTLQGLTIQAQKADEQTLQAAGALEDAALDQRRGAFLGEQLRDISGVNAIQTGPTISKPVIHGLHSNRVLILNNGIRQEGQQWGSEHAPEIDPFIARRLTVIKGAEAVRYGSDAIGGVVMVEPPLLRRTPGLSGEVHSIGYTNGRGYVGSAMLEGHLARVPGLAWRVQGTWRQAGNVQTPRYFLANTGIREHNYSAALGYKRERWEVELFFSRFYNEIGLFSAAHVGNTTDLLNSLSREEPLYSPPFANEFGTTILNPRQEVSHQLFKFNGLWKMTDWAKWVVQIGWQQNTRQEFDRRRAGRSALPALELQLQTITADIALEHHLPGTHWKGAIGLNLLSQANNNNFNTGIIPLIPNYDAQSIGVFVVERYIRERWELEAGLRYDLRGMDVARFDRSQTVLQRFHYDFENVLLSVGGLYRISPALEWRSHIGTAWRPPSPNELFSQGLHQGVAAIEEGNADLRQERSVKWVHTLRYTRKRLQGEAVLYANRIQDYVYLRYDSVRLTIQGAFPVFSYHQQDAMFYGMDLSGRWQAAEHWSWSVKGSAVRALGLGQLSRFPWIPPDRFEHSLRYELAGWKRWKNIFAGITQQWVDTQWRIASEVEFDAPPAGYMLLQTDIGATRPVGKHLISCSLTIANLLNAEYRDYLNRFRYFAHEQGRNFTLRLKWSF